MGLLTFLFEAYLVIIDSTGKFIKKFNRVVKK